MKKILYSILIAASLISMANAADEKASGIMKAVLGGESWTSMTADVKLVLTNSRGEKRERELAFYSAEDGKGFSRLLMRFTAPADVKGTGFLTLETASGTDERYLYLPARRRISKISSSGGGGNFMSSDFSYYDIGKPEYEDWTYSYLGEKEYQGHACHVIEALPARSDILDDTGYGKIEYWIDKDAMHTLFAKYYDENLAGLKTLEVLDYFREGGREFAADMLMVNESIGHSSRMTFTHIKLNEGVDDAVFSPRFLQMGR